MAKQVICLVLVLFGAGSAMGLEQKQDIGQQIRTQADRSMQLMLANISAPGTAAGSVLASPSRYAPNYYFHWIRDAALTVDVVTRAYLAASSKEKEKYGRVLYDYANFSRHNQVTPNRSGGLGEPKFNVDGSAFNEDWGRPQNDGPALRAVALIPFAMDLINQGQETYVRERLYDSRIPTESVIKADLEYVAHHWREWSVDLWEEIGGYHFYTLIVQRRAMVEGAKLAERLGDKGAADFYRSQVDPMSRGLEQFWNPERGMMFETIHQLFGLSKDSGLDVAVVLGVLHGYAGDGFLSPTDDRILATAQLLIQAFRQIYVINADTSVAPAIGRYPEDRYDGNDGTEGNPWFLATLAYAELCYRAKVEFANQGMVRVTNLNKPFLDFVLGGKSQVWPGQVIEGKSGLFQALLDRLVETGDSFFRRVFKHAGPDGALSEQYSRYSGFMMSANNLTWSYASFITAANWRGNAKPTIRKKKLGFHSVLLKNND